MPIKIGNFILTGHRGPFEALRRQLPQPKDSDPNAPASKSETLTPRSGSGKKPMGFSIRRVTDFTALKSVAEVDAALQDPRKFHTIPNLGDASTWAQATIDTQIFEARKTAQNAGVSMKPVLILVGEDHLNPVSTLVGLAAMASARKEAAENPPSQPASSDSRWQPRLVIEIDESQRHLIDESKTHVMRNKFGAHLPEHRQSRNAIDLVKYQPDDLAATMTHHYLVKYHMGRAAGLAVDTLEQGRSDSYVDQREVVMLRRLQESLDRSRGAPVVVLTGVAHLGVLHEAFKSKTTCISLADVPDKLPSHDTLTRKRYGYVLSNPDVRPFQASLAAKTADCDFIKHGRDLGIDLPAHLEPASSALAGPSRSRSSQADGIGFD